MPTISSWMLSIAGIVCLSILIELILPDGQMNKYIKSAFSFVVIFVIISPIPKLLKTDFNISNVFNYQDAYVLDENYLYQVNINKLNALQDDIVSNASANGYKQIKVYVDGDVFNKTLTISSIFVDLSELVISNNAEHKDITKIKADITNIIHNLIEIDKEKIEYGC